MDAVSSTALPLYCPFGAGGFDDAGSRPLSKTAWMERLIRTGRFSSGDLGLKLHIVAQHEAAQHAKRVVTKKVMSSSNIVSEEGLVLVTGEELALAAKEKIDRTYVPKAKRNPARHLLDAAEVSVHTLYLIRQLRVGARVQSR